MLPFPPQLTVPVALAATLSVQPSNVGAYIGPDWAAAVRSQRKRRGKHGRIGQDLPHARTLLCPPVAAALSTAFSLVKFRLGGCILRLYGVEFIYALAAGSSTILVACNLLIPA